MGKFNGVKRLSKKVQDELFIHFAKSLVHLRKPVEAAKFLKDLLSEQEVLMLARRLQIAEMLMDGSKYADIRKVLKVSDSTIARVQTWLQEYGEGYRLIAKRSGDRKKSNNGNSALLDPQSWQSFKRKYPMYFWPEHLLKEIVKAANKRERERLGKVIEEMRGKTRLAKELSRLLSSKYHIKQNFHTT